MKTITTMLILLGACSTVLSAQPLITTNEFYHTGDVIQMVNCDIATVNAGSSGGGVTWDFSKVNPSGGVSTTTVVHDTARAFLTSNLLVTLPNGLKQHETENNTDTYVNGILDTITNTTTNYFNYDQAKRPVTYHTTYVDTYRVENEASSIFGTGYLSETGDAYGTLVLPTGIYNNVLRVKEVQTETDSTLGSVSTFFTTVSYLWFDTMHTAPLFRVDSFNGNTGTRYTAMYLAGPLAVNDATAEQPGYNAMFQNNTLLLFGDFESNKKYDVQILNMIGTRIFSATFVGHGSSQSLDIGRQVVPGIYIVSITTETDPDSRALIKVVRQ